MGCIESCKEHVTIGGNGRTGDTGATGETGSAGANGTNGTNGINEYKIDITCSATKTQPYLASFEPSYNSASTQTYFYFPGTASKTYTTAKVIAKFVAAGEGTTGEIRIIDLTNSTIICTFPAITSASKIILTNSSLANLPVNEAIFVVQAKVSADDDSEIDLYAVTMY